AAGEHLSLVLPGDLQRPPVAGLEQLLPRAVVVDDQAGADAGVLGDGAQRGPQTLHGEALQGSTDDPLIGGRGRLHGAPDVNRARSGLNACSTGYTAVQRERKGAAPNRSAQAQLVPAGLSAAQLRASIPPLLRSSESSRSFGSCAGSSAQSSGS